MSRLMMTVLIALISLPSWAEEKAPPEEDPQLQQDHAAVEGTWRRTYRDETGRELTVTSAL